ncbi:hypothetical protein KIL84_001012 [Mauremys mutica]|uniref:Uncharacterized protein n=1 Tax=Mauremys mutica TaxID=74926 RepID=A0A9D3WZN0_9SAUR|nr:hypothetical protein KIL84_001012 [Mauremys mutica]
MEMHCPVNVPTWSTNLVFDKSGSKFQSCVPFIENVLPDSLYHLNHIGSRSGVSTNHSFVMNWVGFKLCGENHALPAEYHITFSVCTVIPINTSNKLSCDPISDLQPLLPEKCFL